MTKGVGVVLACALIVGLGGSGCGGGGAGAQSKGAIAPGGDTRQAKDRPPLAVVARDGDPRGAIAIAVGTAGIAPERGAEVATALGALVAGRLEASHVDVTPGWDGYRVRALVTGETDAAALIDAIRTAMLSAVGPADVARVQRKVATLAKRPMGDAALAPSVKCTGEAFAVPAGAVHPASPPTQAEIETWRAAAHGLGRVTLAVVGAPKLADAVAAAIAKGAAWPAATALTSEKDANDASTEVYDATGDVPAGGARITLAARTMRAEQAVAAATKLGDPEGALATRLGGLDAPARLSGVTATAHTDGGCTALTVEFAPRDLAGDGAARIATAVALARQEIGAEVAEAGDDPTLARSLARRAGDPRDAAELAAWWALARSARGAEAGDAAPRDVRIATAIGIATGREANPQDTTIATQRKAIRAEIDRALVAWHEPVLETRARVEQGQGELWMLLGSPCGTLAEVDGDAGLGAAFALAAADRADEALRGSQAHAEAWATVDGLGVIVHGPPLAGESPTAHARRLADAAARSFAAAPVDRAAIGRARGLLLAADDREESRALTAVAQAIVPGHPSWIAPLGPIDALGRSSDAAVIARASAMRAGPLRIAVVASDGAEQGEAAALAADRWIARRAGAARACVVPGAPPPPRPGTYAVDVVAGAKSEAWIAVALPPNDEPARTNASWLASILDGQDGLLAHALGNGLARSWSARVVGSARAPALVVRVASSGGALDAAVAQVRALFDRLRQGALSEADRSRAAATRADDDLATSLDPRARLTALWRGPRTTGAPLAAAPSVTAAPPALDALRAFASTTLRDDTLVIIAARPPRPAKPS